MSADFGGEVRVGVAVGLAVAGIGDGDGVTAGTTIVGACGADHASGCTIVTPVVPS